ncbi:MAG: ion transporter [Pseudomonadota bacterium]|nr:MAG: ion transporter [Pseudomonadota bacterium]
MNFKEKLKKLVEDVDSREGRIFALIIQWLIVISVISFSIDTLPGLSASTRGLLHWIEIVTVAIFSVEYLARLYVANRKLAYVFSFYGLVDLVAIAPFYIMAAVDLRAVRALRLLRLLRILKLARYSSAIRRLNRAVRIAKEELVLFATAAVILLYLAAVGIYYFEHDAQPQQFGSIFHSLWWALATLTTVGYGDVYPVTLGGKVFTFFVLSVGLGIVAVPAGLVASALAQARREESEERQRNSEQRDKSTRKPKRR